MASLVLGSSDSETTTCSRLAEVRAYFSSCLLFVSSYSLLYRLSPILSTHYRHHIDQLTSREIFRLFFLLLYLLNQPLLLALPRPHKLLILVHVPQQTSLRFLAVQTLEFLHPKDHSLQSLLEVCYFKVLLLSDSVTAFTALSYW